jgi:hypothetical protein
VTNPQVQRNLHTMGHSENTDVIFKPGDSPGLLAHTQPQCVDQQRRQYVQEECVDLVHCRRAACAEGHVPNGVAERKLEAVIDVELGKVTPGQWIVVGRHEIIHGHFGFVGGLFGGRKLLVFLVCVPGGGQEGVDRHVDGHNVGVDVFVAVHCSKNSGSNAGHDASGTVEVVDPSDDGFLGRGCDWGGKSKRIPVLNRRLSYLHSPIAGRNMPIGKCSDCLRTKSSAKALVKA